MAWRVAKAIEQLIDEVDAVFPQRSKASDGTVGDAAHAAKTSDHNPWVMDGATGVVTACDITEDAENGVAEIADFIVNTLVRNRDSRVKYIIHEGKIWRSYPKDGLPAWTPGPYDGTNGHFKHVHVSVKPEKALYDSTRSWGIRAALDGVRPPSAVSQIRTGVLRAVPLTLIEKIPKRRVFARSTAWTIRRAALSLPKD